MRIEHLRIAGFKSFVNETIVPLPDGITVVVGPNGCGKSNIVEALRWVMGEASAKRMRAEEMDDVIFSGSSGRSKRDFAEVSVLLNNDDNTAPPPYQAQPELEVCRRIDRGRGSFYRINGGETRARDVQFLFADQGSGAASSAIVGQGKITQLLEAKPTERRILLEEAAGIRGLQSRKHESELKLQATEGNLQKLQEIFDEKNRLNAELLKQAAEAQKYRDLSDEISDMERLIAAMEWHRLYQWIEQLKTQLDDNLKNKTASETSMAQHAETVASLTEQLDPLKEKSTNATASLRQAQLELSRTEDAEKRLTQELTEWQGRLQEGAADATHAEEAAIEAQAKCTETQKQLASMDTEFQSKQKALKELLPTLQTTEDKQKQTYQHIQNCENEDRQMQEKNASLQSRIAELENEKQAQLAKITATEDQLQKLKGDAEDWATNDGEIGGDQQLEELAKSLQQQTKEADTASIALQNLRDEFHQLTEAARQEESDAENMRAPYRQALQEIQAEIQLMTKMLAENETSEDAVIDLLQPKKGYESAIAVLLGEAATAGLSQQAKSYWQELDELQADTPENLICAKDIVKAPKALARRLQYSFIADDMSQALAIMPKLLAGQIIVTKDGGLCRWDGYVKSAEQLSVLAKNLQQKNRLTELQKILPSAEADMEKVEAKIATSANKKLQARESLQAKITEAEAGHKELLATVRNLYEKRQTLQNQMSAESQRRQDLKNRMAIAEQRLHDYRENLTAIEKRQNEVQSTLEELQKNSAEENEKRQAELVSLRSQAEELDNELQKLRSQHGLLQGEVSVFSETKTRLQNDANEWRMRDEREQKRHGECLERVELAKQKIAEYEAMPDDLKQKKSQWLDEISKREAVAKQANEAAAEVESSIYEAENKGREIRTRLTQLTELHEKLSGDSQSKKEELQNKTAFIEEKFLLSPSQLLEAIGEERLQAEAGNLDKLRGTIQRLEGRREAIGEVNLLAEREAETLSQELTELDSEREDLEEAVRKLRLAVSRLNAKARERLKEAFDLVNGNFEALFAKLFGGGTAKLNWIGEADVLQAGLEIVVTLPGKRERILSLLSGGEQTLTALALLSAVFVSRPAMVFILDEVDALLDDSNVSRFCDLLAYLKDEVSVKFLVVSHHRLTMARADRLYGVTMAERGVSSLVSVDMDEAEKFIE